MSNAYDRNLLKLAQVKDFRTWLRAVGIEHRDGKGEFQLLQVRTAPDCWAAINRNAQNIVSTHPQLKSLIHGFLKCDSEAVATCNPSFKGEKAFQNFHRRLCERFGMEHDPVDWWRDQASLEEHIASLIAKPAPAPTSQFLDDLRDDFAMRILPGMMVNNPFEKPLLDLTIEAYAVADLALFARGYAKCEAQRTPKKSDKWHADWKANGFNHCMTQAAKALRHLANNERPSGGQSDFNSEHLMMIASELEVTQRELLTP
jgi:hypothetical protein